MLRPPKGDRAPYVCFDVFSICSGNQSDTDTLHSQEEGLFPFVLFCYELTGAVNTGQNGGSR